MPGTVHVLMPGDVVCADQGVRLETLLGSCVAVVMTDRRRTVGAMCHIVHTRPAGSGGPLPGGGAQSALDEMYGQLRRRGFTPSLCEAFVFGGGNMFPELVEGTHVGERNGDYVLRRLAADQVRVVQQDLGGHAYRRLSWTVGPGLPEVMAVQV